MKARYVLVAAAILTMNLAARADSIQTVGQYTSTSTGGPIAGQPGSPYPISYTVGTFTILPDDSAVTISGAFGNYGPNGFQNSAAVYVYLGTAGDPDDILVASCPADYTYCSGQGQTMPDPWSYALTASDFASLGTGTDELTAVETEPPLVALSETTLDQVTGSVAPSVTPEPSGMVLLSTGLLGVCGAVRRRFI